MPEQLVVLHEWLERVCAVTGRVVSHPPDQEWYFQFITAVMEIANNIARYAYPDRSDPNSVELRVRAYHDRIEAQFSDHGITYTAPPPAPQVLEDDDWDIFAIPEGGYGLALVRAAVDHLEYHRTPGGVNHWRLVKQFIT